LLERFGMSKRVEFKVGSYMVRVWFDPLLAVVAGACFGLSSESWLVGVGLCAALMVLSGGDQ